MKFLAVNFSFYLLVLTLLLLLFFGSYTYFFRKEMDSFFKRWWVKYLIAGIVYIGILTVIDIYVGFFKETSSVSSGWLNILAEAHGLIFDLFIVVLIIGFFERKEQNRESKEDLLEELESYKDWNNEESTFRKLKIIKSILKITKNPLDLGFHSFIKGNFKDIDYKKIEIDDCTFETCNFPKGVIKADSFSSVISKDSNFYNVEFLVGKMFSFKSEGCSFSQSSFHSCNFRRSCKFIKCHFNATKFYRCQFSMCSFENSIFYGEFSFKECEFNDVNLDGVFFPDLRRDDVTALFNNWLSPEKLKSKYSVSTYSLILMIHHFMRCH